ncbi:hypothetical protein D3C76_1277040 [compost metagenome]
MGRDLVRESAPRCRRGGSRVFQVSPAECVIRGTHRRGHSQPGKRRMDHSDLQAGERQEWPVPGRIAGRDQDVVLRPLLQKLQHRRKRLDVPRPDRWHTTGAQTLRGGADRHVVGPRRNLPETPAPSPLRQRDVHLGGGWYRALVWLPTAGFLPAGRLGGIIQGFDSGGVV